LFSIGFALAVTAPAVGLDPESRSAYQLRVVVRTGDHPTLTRHFRTEVTKSVTSALQAALGPVGSVESVDLNEAPADKRDALINFADEKGLEALDEVKSVAGGKTHFVFVDFADGKYEIRTRQHDGTTGFVTPMVRKTVHGDRGFVGRLAGLAVAQDFGAVGTFDPTGAQVSVVLKAGELGPMGAWVKKGEVFAAIQIREVRRPPTRPGKEKGKAEMFPTSTAIGSRMDGVLLQVIEAPRNGVCVCKLHNRYRSLPRDPGFLGYRCVKLGTGEAPLKLQLTDATGTPFRGDMLQPRAGMDDFPDAPREREEMTFSGGVFTSKEPFKHVAFVMVRAGDAPIARIPVEIYPDQVAVRRVNLADKVPSAVEAAAADMLERIRSARVIQARAFEDLSTLQKKEKPKALEYGQAAYDSLSKEADVLRADLTRMKDRYGTEPGLFGPCEGELRTLDAKTGELRTHLAKLRDVIKVESDPATATARKGLEGLLLEAGAAAKNLDYDQAIAKYEEALKNAGLSPTDKEEIEKLLEGIKKKWEVKDVDHAAARKFVYEVWAKLESPPDVKDAIPEARRAVAKSKAVGDKITLQKMYDTAPALLQRYRASLEKLVDEAEGDPDKLAALEGYKKVNKDLEELLKEVASEIGPEAGK
jgi:hypothetical protein